MRVKNKASQRKHDKHAVKVDTLLANLRSKTPQQAADWVEDNVTDLASAKQVLKAFAKVIVVLSKEVGD